MKSNTIRNNVLSRAGVIAVLGLILLIPLQMVAGLVEERKTRQKEAEREVTSHWASSQQVAGPILLVPFSTGSPKKLRGKSLHILPDTLSITGDMDPEKRSRGLYDVMLYRSGNLKLSGTFSQKSLNYHGYPLKWDAARVVMILSDSRGVMQEVSLTWNGSSRTLQPGNSLPDIAGAAFTAWIGNPKKHTGTHRFSCTIPLKGSTSLAFVPLGRISRGAMKSSWPHPSFFGSTLPSEEKITDQGFSALWSVTGPGSGLPRRWVTGHGPGGAKLIQAVFGVSLYQPVDVYQKVTRGVKYWILFILLTFLTFFLYDLFFSLGLHPLQFMMIGFALVLFFLLFLALSEHVPFTVSYILASFSVIGLIAGYSRAILKENNRGTVIAGLLTILYGYLYIVLVTRDYALLLGSVALMGVLTTVMYLTRNIDWYQLKEQV